MSETLMEVINQVTVTILLNSEKIIMLKVGVDTKGSKPEYSNHSYSAHQAY